MNLSNLSGLVTEQRNPNSINLDGMPTRDILQLINEEDKQVAVAVDNVLPQIETVVTQVYNALKSGGRLFYVGAGTSGRLGIMDASECPPTFMTSPELVQTVMAGGNGAFFKAVEGAEDQEEQGALDIAERNLTAADAVIGITASGRTPYPIGAVKYAKKIGAFTASLTSNPNSEISSFVDFPMEVVVGPEILTGSTRMKAATSHKMVLNMISTAVMVKLGKVYENLMVDVHASNYKLKERAKRNVIAVTEASYESAEEVLEKTDYKVKPAIIMLKTGKSLQEVDAALVATNGNVREAITALVGE
ncbi:N-acetylmuramic acid 6-phosphate etherase [Oceanobacillus manasiensis]|uniref:N-acetylmuramic acid 6-phosphate etherase n=1 Tax=Oceanobacillus manasiensis TaxID=586413 RepID=UPI0005AB8584|nr:N-acetylmuramic acid 6-phosphate etherase [Oceanobacillus manasiensis]